MRLFMIKYKNPFKPQTLIAGDVLAYEVPQNTVSQVRACTFHNKSANNVSIEVYITPSNVDVVDLPQRLIRKTLAQDESYLCPEIVNHALESGHKIYFKGEGVNAMLSVMEQAV